MLQINELKIEDSKLIIDATVKDLSYFVNVNIDYIKIDNQDTFSENGASSAAYIVPENKITRDGKNVHAELEQIDFTEGGKLNFTLSKDLFFVYVITEDAPTSDTPCGMDKSYIAGAVTNMKILYNRGMKYIKELSDSCSIPSGFIDFILKYKAFVLSLNTCDFSQAIIFWRKFFANDRITTTRCGCHG